MVWAGPDRGLNLGLPRKKPASHWFYYKQTDWPFTDQQICIEKNFSLMNIWFVCLYIWYVYRKWYTQSFLFLNNTCLVLYTWLKKKCVLASNSLSKTPLRYHVLKRTQSALKHTGMDTRWSSENGLPQTKIKGTHQTHLEICLNFASSIVSFDLWLLVKQCSCLSILLLML